ncbi:MAG: beta-ketoacyl-[acyl-carrier-protein] synthase II [Candidatus Zixiibacteriota bacterium]|nr:MAG: beta-ketoacyl-[acyl-carrier-protein] synthase II [candidate division Zixibacteria bacterium]
MKNRVVVTGMGAVTPIGNTVAEFWEGLLTGRSGAAPITRFDASQHSSRFACEVKNFKVEDYIPLREAKRMDPFCQYAMAAADQAVKDSGLNLEALDRDRCGVVVGSGIGGIPVFEAQTRDMIEGGPRRLSPFFIPTMISDIAAGHISMKYQFKGVNYATTSACATGNHAIGLALRHLQYGDADVILTGGSEGAVSPMGVGGFCAMKALSTRNDDPQHASRPFDLERDGFVVGEGAGILILETLDHARRRGARILAEVLGLGFTADAYHITAPAPEGEGAVRAMRMALKDAGLQPEEVDYVNAHGTSTPLNDKTETVAIKTVFGDYAARLNVSSTKSMTGHLLGAAGAVESVACILAMQYSMIPPTINYTTPDPECDLNVTPNRPVERSVRVALNNAFGFGGHNACLVFLNFKE